MLRNKKKSVISPVNVYSKYICRQCHINAMRIDKLPSKEAMTIELATA